MGAAETSICISVLCLYVLRATPPPRASNRMGKKVGSTVAFIQIVCSNGLTRRMTQLVGFNVVPRWFYFIVILFINLSFRVTRVF